MKTRTLHLIEAALCTDETLTPVVRRAILQMLAEEPKSEPSVKARGPLLTKKEAAARIGVCTTTFWKMLKELPPGGALSYACSTAPTEHGASA